MDLSNIFAFTARSKLNWFDGYLECCNAMLTRKTDCNPSDHLVILNAEINEVRSHGLDSLSLQEKFGGWLVGGGWVADQV